jgi:RNA polymerase sigma factor (sigma-70 family)
VTTAVISVPPGGAQLPSRGRTWSVRAAGRFEGLPDDALVTAMALGEPQAADAFVRRFERRVFGLAVSITKDRSLAEDVAQQSFVRAWRFAGGYEADRGTVVAWLLRITRNQAIDAVTARRPVPVDPAEMFLVTPAGTELASIDRDPLAHAVVTDDIARMQRELAAIPEEQRRAVVLASIAGRSMAEIADIEHVPVGTVKTRIRLGMARLRTAMEEPS